MDADILIKGGRIIDVAQRMDGIGTLHQRRQDPIGR